MLAVDDLIVGGRLRMGLSLDSLTGELSDTLQAGEILTGSDGKTSAFSVDVNGSTTTVYFQVQGGQEGPGGPQLSNQTRFTGLVDLSPGSTTAVVPRVNITPFSTLIAQAKSRSPGAATTNLVSEALNQFLVSSNSQAYDMNSQSYQGFSTAQVESGGDGAVLQLINEMIRSAASSLPGTTVADRVSVFLRPTTAPAGTGVFFEGDPVFKGLSLVSTKLSTNPGAFGSFFSTALTQISTMDAISFKPTGFVSRPLGASAILLDSAIEIDSTTVVIQNVINSTAYLGAVSGTGLVTLVKTPDRIRMNLVNNLYQAALETTLFLKVEKSTDNLLEAFVDPVELLTTIPAEIRFPAGAQIQGRRVSPGGSNISATIQNQSEDRFISETNYLDLDLKELRLKAENASGAPLPSLEGDIFSVEIRFGRGIRFQTPGVSSVFSALILTSATVNTP